MSALLCEPRKAVRFYGLRSAVSLVRCEYKVNIFTEKLLATLKHQNWLTKGTCAQHWF